MGQAKARGSFEQRKTEGIARRKAEEEQRALRLKAEAQQRDEERRAREAAMPPEQRKRLRNGLGMMAAVLGTSLASSISTGRRY